MTLPVSSYEELLARVRSLTNETIQLQKELTSSLSDSPNDSQYYATHPQRKMPEAGTSTDSDRFLSYDSICERPTRPTSLFPRSKENETDLELKDIDEKHSSPSTRLLQHNAWGPEALGGLWHSGPSSLTVNHSNNQDLSSVMSFTSSMGSAGLTSAGGLMTSSRRAYSHQQLGAKVEMVYNLLSMLGTNDRDDMSKTLLAMSSSAESCQAMRQSGCLPLLIQLIHSPELELEVRSRASEALHNIVHAQNDEKRRRRESRILKLLEQIREYCDTLKMNDMNSGEADKHPGPAIAALMKFSFDEEHRHAMCTLGGLHAIAELVQVDHNAHGNSSFDELCVTLRRYAGMALTNLTFGDGNNKALLCSLKKFMIALVAQLSSPSEDLIQVTASVLRNLSWRADNESKQTLREVGAVTSLMSAAMQVQKEATLKSILSALWNLSAHCSMNKVDICSVPGALSFLVKMLSYQAPSNTLAVVENAGGILRNISSHIAIREDYRQVLRDNNCFEVLLEQLKSPSLTVVSNACGTLWNLSARCQEDQKRLWDMGAATMLRSLVQSKHKMISMGSSAALKNLLTANPNGNVLQQMDSTARGLGLQALPTLFARKQRALEQELDANLAETCENIETVGDKSRSRSEDNRPSQHTPLQRRSTSVPRSDSRESITSTHSDSVYERVCRVAGNLYNKTQQEGGVMHNSLNMKDTKIQQDEQKLMRRYKTSMIPTPAKKKENKELGVVSEESSPSKSEKKPEPKRGIPVLKNRTKLKLDKGQPIKFVSNGSCFTYEEEESPVNYSLKYKESETKQDYAETDLDQLTDFSLKYGEPATSDEEIKGQEDTIRTYCTEGTPYETPYNFSTATSMSDLRADDQKELVDNFNQMSIHDNRTSRQVEESGVSSPERPVQYLEEGTPASCFSRVSSSSSLHSSDKAKLEKKEEIKEKVVKKDETQGKMVTFGQTEHYACADQTPLMFSRTSSLNSLSSFDQLNQPIPDDRSSVVSDFSRRTSGAVSPSELPDSPTQTVPPSPKATKSPSSFPVEKRNVKKSVFEDELATYRQEGTPSEFSRGTSLSSLTIEKSSKTEDNLKANSSASSVVSLSSVDKKNDSEKSDLCKADCEKEQVVPEKIDEEKERLELEEEGEVGDADEHMLADCINVGIQDNRHRPRPSNLKPRVPVKKLTTPHRGLGTYEDTIHTYFTEGTPANISHAGSNSDLSQLSFNTHQTGIEECSDTSSLCSGENENILAECIQSGMPQAKPKTETGKKSEEESMGSSLNKSVATVAPVRSHKIKLQPSPAKDELAGYATENSPCVFSTRSSLSDLTINSVESSNFRHNDSRPSIEGNSASPLQNCSLSEETSPHSTSLVDCTDGAKSSKNASLQADDSKLVSLESDTKPSISEDLVTALSRNASPTLSVESFDSCEPTPLEQALLEQCIHSGMPHKEKTEQSKNVSTAPVADNVTGEKNIDLMNASFGNHTWSESYTSPESATSVSVSEREGLRVLEDEPVVPKFKIGSETNARFLTDASRVIRELRKQFEMSASANSEMSAVSVNSFIDSAEYSHLESADDLIKFSKRLIRMKSYPATSMEHNTLNTLEFLDLESSMISVASITSEVADVSRHSPTENFLKVVNVVNDKFVKEKIDKLNNGEIDTATATLEKYDLDNVYTETLCSEQLDSDTEVYDADDNSIHEEHDLPLDPESPKKKTTPKEKRQMVKERYKTYTIQDIEEDRFRTYTKEELKNRKRFDKEEDPKRKISSYERWQRDEDNVGKKSNHTREEEEDNSQSSPRRTSIPKYRSSKLKRQTDKDRYRTRTLSSGQIIELIKQTTNVQPVDDMSDVLSIDEENNATFIIDDRTYDNTEDETETLQEEIRGPRISKPNETLQPESEPEIKAVRGRRKPLYSSPYKRPSTTSPQLQRQGTFTKEDKPKKPPSTPAVRNKSAPSLRHNTKPVGELKTPRPVSSYVGKSITDRNGYLNHKRHSSAGASNVSANSAPNTQKRHSSTGGSAMKNSSSNHSIKSNSSTKTVINAKSRTAMPTQRSKSNISLDSRTPTMSPTHSAKSKAPKKEVTSKIASLWKKVEETKKKVEDTKKIEKFTGNRKDNRIWITADKQKLEEPEDEILVIEKEEILELASGKIVRSSTFQGLVDGVPKVNKSKNDDKNKVSRKSGDFSSAKWEASSKKAVVSAIVPPFNYSPPAQQVTNVIVKTQKIENTFHKGSMKVTTV